MVLRSEQMTREATKEFVRQHPSLRDRADNWNWLIDKIYDDFEEELKKAYIEGNNDGWKQCREFYKTRDDA